jgi:hypothetical protein
VIAVLALALLLVPAVHEPPKIRCGTPVPRVAATGTATNLRITARGRAALRTTFLACHVDPAARVTGPLPGSVYYARYRGFDWAVATFSVPPAGATDQPERFVRRTGAKRWTDLGDSGSPLAELGIPCPVLRVWRMPCG